MAADTSSVLYLHPNDGSYSISVDKMTGASDYRSWKRSMEIALTVNKKIRFIQGTVLISTYAANAATAEQWDTCNSMIQLEKRFSMCNGSRKYKLNKDLYNLKQNGNPINVYYTRMTSLWEEIDSMNALPVMSEPTPELLMVTPLPTVESACSMLQQEESQREVLSQTKSDSDISAVYSRNSGQNNNGQSGNGNFSIPQNRLNICSACGVRGHTPERCWTVIGYLSWHHKYKTGSVKLAAKPQRQKWSNKPAPSLVAVAQSSQGARQTNTGNVTLTQQQFEQLLRQIPSSGKGNETDEELDSGFLGMVSCHTAVSRADEWIIDSEASDHMTSCLECVTNPRACHQSHMKINLPTRATANVTHKGLVELPNSLYLQNVLAVPNFIYNLLSVNKLMKDSQCEVIFSKTYCLKSLDSYMTPVPPVLSQKENFTHTYLDELSEYTENSQPENNPENTTPDSPTHFSPQNTYPTTNQPQNTSPNPNEPDILVRHSTRPSKEPYWMKDYVQPSKRSDKQISNLAFQAVQPEFHYFMTNLVKSEDPVLFKSAVTDQNWVSAMNKELDQCEQNGTWEVTMLLEGKRTIGCKWIYKTKYKSNGEIERHKARIDVLGCRQKYGLHALPNFNPYAGF
uniref:Uncharacterized protein n=1 Tax=Chenopodium quinoa TaxID=63459 RepID=A0A803NAW9_CHEQI